MCNLRNLILGNIELLRGREHEFLAKDIMRWRRVAFVLPDGKVVHVSEVDYQNLPDNYLLQFYSTVLAQSTKQF